MACAFRWLSVMDNLVKGVEVSGFNSLYRLNGDRIGHAIGEGA